MLTAKNLRPGTRVYIREPHFLLTLRSHTGEIVRKDAYLDGYIVRLDEPAIYHHPDGTHENLPEIRESAANLEALSPDC
ncbi:MAG: hypothetical protein ACRDIY_04710 [Chloroflexota bacterium]